MYIYIHIEREREREREGERERCHEMSFFWWKSPTNGDSTAKTCGKSSRNSQESDLAATCG
jgi:hypothetical protein